MAQASWIRKLVQLDEYSEELVTHWQYIEERIVYTVVVRDFYSDWESTKQFSIFKPPYEDKSTNGAFSKEPNMSEKKFVLDGVNTEFAPDEIAFEVFPAKNNIVDKFDIYHIWSLKKQNIPFYTNFRIPAFILRWKKITINNKTIMYTKRIRYTTRGIPIRVYFVRAADKSELKWYDKQNFKDTVIGEETVAVEFISDDMKNISTLVCAPKSIKKLPFGLR